MKRHVAGAGGVEEHAQLAGDHQIDSCLFYVPVQSPPPPSMRTLPGLGNAAKPRVCLHARCGRRASRSLKTRTISPSSRPDGASKFATFLRPKHRRRVLSSMRAAAACLRTRLQ